MHTLTMKLNTITLLTASIASLALATAQPAAAQNRKPEKSFNIGEINGFIRWPNSVTIPKGTFTLVAGVAGTQRGGGWNKDTFAPISSAHPILGKSSLVGTTGSANALSYSITDLPTNKPIQLRLTAKTDIGNAVNFDCNRNVVTLSIAQKEAAGVDFSYQAPPK
jgi:hypothetical protein